MCRQVLEARELEPGADLRTELTEERLRRIAAGWSCQPIGHACAVFFAESRAERIQIGIERYHPEDPGPMHSDRA